MQRIVLALALTGAAGLIAPQCTVRAPRAGLLRAEAAEAPAEATPAPTFKVIDIPSDKWTAAQKQEKTALETAAPPASTSPPEAPRCQRRAAGSIRRRRGTTSTPSRHPDAVDARAATQWPRHHPSHNTQAQGRGKGGSRRPQGRGGGAHEGHQGQAHHGRLGLLQRCHEK